MSARARLTAARDWLEPTTWLDLFVVNADNYRHPAEEVGLELATIAAAFRPAVIGVVEGLGNKLPEIPGYQRLRDVTSKPRENVAAYVRDDLAVSHVAWLDMDHGWPRTEGPGEHEPRSILTFRIGGRVRVLVAHDPDPRAKGPAREEHRHTLRHLARRYRLWPVLILEDSNGNAPWLLRQVPSLRRFGEKVDTVLARGARRGHARYLSTFPRTDRRGSLEFRGDHGHVLRVGLKIPTRFLTPRPPRATDPRLREVPA